MSSKISFGANVTSKSARTSRASDVSMRRDVIDIGDIMQAYHLQEIHFGGRLNSTIYGYLQDIDPLDILATIHDVREELKVKRLENYVFHNFLSKNDSKVIAQLLAAQQNVERKSVSRMKNTVLHPSMSDRQSFTSARKAGKKEYALSLAHRREMLERLYREKDIALKALEVHYRKDMCHVRARCDEQQLLRAEVVETEKNFLLHFNPRESLPEATVQNKLTYFTHIYCNYASDWLCSIRLKIGTLSQDCRNILSEITVKKDKRMSLTAADLESIEQRLQKMELEYEMKAESALLLKHHVLIKTTEMNKESKAYSNDHVTYNQVLECTAGIQKSCNHMNNDLKLLHETDRRHRNEMNEKRLQSKQYSAPSTEEYLSLKMTGSIIMREVEVLRRKIAILNINLPKSERIKVAQAKRKSNFV